MSEIDHDKLNAEAFQKFIKDLEVVFEYEDHLRIRVYQDFGKGMREVARVEGGQLDGTQGQFDLVMKILSLEIYQHWQRSRLSNMRIH